MKCNNLNPGMATVVTTVSNEANSRIQVRMDMFQTALTLATDKMSHHSQAREEAVHVCGIMLAEKCDNNLEQRINVRFCVKIDKSASETLQ
jgi:hypothetical protein